MKNVYTHTVFVDVISLLEIKFLMTNHIFIIEIINITDIFTKNVFHYNWTTQFHFISV